MVQLLIRTGISIVANAIGLVLTAYVLEDFTLNTSSFIITVLIFSAVSIILGPLIFKVVHQYAEFLLGGIALVTTLISLIVTNVLADGFDIKGADTWLIATFTIWVFSMVGNLLIPWLLIKFAIMDDPDKPDIVGNVGQE